MARGLEVLRCFGPRDRWLANQEIARRAGLARPTVTRLAYTLTLLGYLRHSEKLDKYSLGGAALSLGFSSLAQMDVRRVARPLMQALSEHSKGAVHFAVRDRSSMVMVDTYRNSASLLVEIAARVPIATTAVGRAYYCALPRAGQRTFLEGLRNAHPEHLAAAKRALERAEVDYKRYGFCMSLGDWRRDVNAIAVPMLQESGSEPLVFGCSGAAFQLSPNILKRDVGPRLQTLVGNVRSALAGE